ncbi:MAG: 50S ribosomal protein L21, partial [Pseudomonadota bacterium]|nr:50S ribosomal protein L21 [Pseudomonadota bacterium]
QMYAVIETGGKQYRVAVGENLKIEKLDAGEGSTVELDRVLMVSDDGEVTIGAPTIENTTVSAKVVSHGRGEKIKVFKMKRRKDYRLTQGHRQDYTEIEITAIGGKSGGGTKAAPKGKAAPKVEAAVKTEAAPEKEPQAAVEEGDDLTRINGIGEVLEGKLKALDITTFRQIADLTAEDIDQVNEKLDFKGRIEREEWVEQAKKLI